MEFNVRYALMSKGLSTTGGAEQIKSLLEVIYGVKGIERKTVYIISHPGYEKAGEIGRQMEEMGFNRGNITVSGFEAPDPEYAPDIILCDEGNTFLVLEYLILTGIYNFLKQWMMLFNKQKLYIGCSAGAAVLSSSLNYLEEFEDKTSIFNCFEVGLAVFGESVAIVPHFTNEQLKNYLEEGYSILHRYKKILAIGNEEVVLPEDNGDESIYLSGFHKEGE